MGEVYLAQDTKLERKVALKFLTASHCSEFDFKARFEHEAKATAALNHPNIVTVYDLGEHDGQLFIAMEYLTGETLASIIERQSLSIQRSLNITEQISRAQSAAQRRLQLVIVPRLGNQGADAQGLQLRGRDLLGPTGDDHTNRIGAAAGRLSKELRTVHDRHPVVGQDRVDGPFVENAKGLLDGLGGQDLVAFAAQGTTQRRKNAGLIIYDQERANFI